MSEQKIGLHCGKKQTGKLKGKAHKRMRTLDPLFVLLHVGVQTANTLADRAAITHQHPAKTTRQRGRLLLSAQNQ